MIMNALNGVWLDTYIQQILIHEELEKLTKILQKKNMILKKLNFQLKLKIFTNSKNELYRHYCFDYENKEKYPIYLSKIFSKDMLIYH